MLVASKKSLEFIGDTIEAREDVTRDSKRDYS